MKMNGRMTWIIMVILVFGSLYLGMSPITPVAGVGDVNDDVKPGMTYYYKVNEFPSFQELLDLMGVPSEGNESLVATGSLVDSEIYVKIIDINSESGNYWDGSKVVSGSVPVVDLSVGLITGQDVSVTLTQGEEVVETTFPSGMGLPVPFIFGSATQFNISNFREDVLPIPVVLNDDYDLHETIFTQVSNMENVSGVSVINDASQFGLEAEDTPIGEGGEILLNGRFAYNKTNGLAQVINFDITNSTTAEVLIDVNIELDTKEYNPVVVETGDHFEFEVTDAGFSSITHGFPADEDPQDILDEINQNMTESIGDVLVEFDVVNVEGMYYSVEGTVLAPNGSRIDFPTGEDGFNNLWMVGFGRIGPGMPQTTNDPTNSSETIYAGENGYIPITTRRRALPGPLVSQDPKIYQAWDLTMSYIVGLVDTELNSLLMIVEEMSEGNLDISSSTSEDPLLDLGYSSTNSDEGYSAQFSVGVDLAVWANETSVDSYWNGTHQVEEVREKFSETFIDGDFTMELAYNHTYAGSSFDTFSISSNLNLTRHEYNSTHAEIVLAGITINDFIFEITGTFNPINPPVITDTTDTTGDTTATATEPELPLPGFEVYIALISIFGIGIMVRRKRFA